MACYQRTTCRVRGTDYLLRRINAEEEPVVLRTREARRELVASAAELILALHWRDFEVLVDLLFARGGWQRVSELGGTMKDLYLVVEQPITAERISVQVKSKSLQAVLDAAAAAFAASGAPGQLYFVCYSPGAELKGAANGRVAAS